jgi:tRNA pseudouridine65 synthase
MGPERRDVVLLHRDDDMVVVAKPSGLLVHRGWGDDEVVALTLVRDLVGRHVHPVHRLDRATSGVLVMALSTEAARALSFAWESGAVHKRYVALVRGLAPERGVVDHPVPRTEGGDRVPAVTWFRRLHALDGPYSVVEAEPRTGRLHQIRRHMKHLAHPLIGDVNYGKGEHNRLFRERWGLRRLALHASAIALPHPRHGARMVVVAPPPDDLAAPFERLGVPPSVWDASAWVARLDTAEAVGPA